MLIEHWGEIELKQKWEFIYIKKYQENPGLGVLRSGVRAWPGWFYVPELEPVSVEELETSS